MQTTVILFTAKRINLLIKSKIISPLLQINLGFIRKNRRYHERNKIVTKLNKKDTCKIIGKFQIGNFIHKNYQSIKDLPKASPKNLFKSFVKYSAKMRENFITFSFKVSENLHFFYNFNKI